MGAKMILKCLLVTLISASLFVIVWLYTAPHHWLLHCIKVLCLLFTLTICLISFHMSLSSPADSHSLQTLCIQYLAVLIFKVYGYMVYKNLIAISKAVVKSQEEILADILTQNVNTEYGRSHKFNQITDVFDRQAFSEMQPLTDYNDYQEYMERIAMGEDNILTAPKVEYLATTSGTTGYRKLIPITDNMKNKTGKKIGPMMFYMIHCKAPLKLGKMLLISYMPKLHESPCGLTIGPVSYHMSRYIPFTTSPRPVYNIDNEQTALFVHAVFALKEREISHLEGIFSTLVHTFWTIVEQRWKDICFVIETGILPITNLNIDDKIAKEIQENLIADPTRAIELREILNDGMQNIAKRLWPGLQSARMLTTGSFHHQAQIVRKVYMPNVVIVSQLHVMSEGFMGIDTSMIAGTHNYTVMPFYGMMEYIKEQDIQLPQPKTYFVEQLMVGECYEVVLTTPMGFYRYRTGDIIEITGHLNQLPIYEFKCRSGQLLNLFWEKTSEDRFYAAIVNAAADLDVDIVEYTATENMHLHGVADDLFPIKHYVLFIEITRNNEEITLHQNQTYQFDAHLRLLVQLYDDLRGKDSIGCMQVYQLKPDTMAKLKQHIIKNTQNQQFKFPHVMRNQEHLKFLVDRVKC